LKTDIVKDNSMVIEFSGILYFDIVFKFDILFNFSSFFLTGPLKQLKNMFKEKRIIATIVMLVCALK
jgi:hypothetical protein